MSLIDFSKANLPNLRRLFVEARTEAEESAYSRNAVSNLTRMAKILAHGDIVLQHCTIYVLRCGLQSDSATCEQRHMLRGQISGIGLPVREPEIRDCQK